MIANTVSKLVVVWILAASFQLYADTVAYWKFDVGPANTIVQTGTNDYVFSADIPDVSGNGNHLSAWNDTPNSTSIWFRNNLPYSTIPQTGNADEFSMQNYGSRACTFTSSSDSNPSGIDAESITPAQFTVEAFLNPEDTQDPASSTGIGTIVNRDAYNIYSIVPGTSAFSLRVQSDNSIEVYFVDVSGYLHTARSASGIVACFDSSNDSTGVTGTWYHVAAVSDGLSLKLYLTNITDEGSTGCIAETNLTLSGSPDTSLSTDDDLRSTWHGGSWAVFRGLSGTGHGYRFQGLIDEVRISNVALNPIDFLCSEPQLSDLLEVESVRSAYLNEDNALFAFKCLSANDLNVQLTFEDSQTGSSPAPAIQITVDSSLQLQQETIDISSWPDGDYEVTVQEVRQDSIDTGTFIRAIRKQTIIAPQGPSEPIDIAGRKMLFMDDWYIASESQLDREVQQGQTIPLQAWHEDSSYFRNDTWITDFCIGQDQKMYVHLHARNGKDSNDDPEDELDYWLSSDDYQSWDIVNEPTGIDDDYEVITFDETKVKDQFSGTPTYSYYDAQEDGPVNLEQVSIYSSGYDGVTLGSILVPARCRIAVWERPDGEYLILTPDAIVSDKWEFESTEIGQWTDTNDNYGPEHLSMDGDTLRFYQCRSVPRNDPFRVYYDNILVSRIMVVWSSQDGVNWEPTYFEIPDETETLGLQHYGIYVFNEEENNLEIGYVRMFDQVTQLTFTDLAYSRDGLLWNRFGDTHFIENGEFGSWNFGFTYPAGNRMRLDTGNYYFEPVVGIDVPHFMFISVVNKKDRSYVTESYYANKYDSRLYDEDTGIPSSDIWSWYNWSWDTIVDATQNMVTTPGLVKYRKDGWVSIGNETGTGTFTTKTLSAGKSLHINAETASNGYVLVEVLDENGNDLSGYCGNNGAVFTGDSVHSQLLWSSGSTSLLPDQSIKLRVTVHKSKLFSLNFGVGCEVIYVDCDAVGQNNGTSWTDAYSDLQDALEDAEYGDQIWVSEGTYIPTQNVNDTLARYEAFELKSGVAIYGGFSGVETLFSQRDHENNETILSGDLAGNDGTAFANYSENSRHVVIGENADHNAILDGFTITAGCACDTASPHTAGGGLVIWQAGSPTIRNCTFVGNISRLYGGAVYAGPSSINITGCRFEGNVSRSGGAVRLNFSNNVLIDDCVFIGNGGDTSSVDTIYGGAISNWGSDYLEISNCYFILNQTIVGLSSVGYGGAIITAEDGSTDILNCVFNSNAADRGGAVRLNANSTNIVNCTFGANTASIAGRAISLDTSTGVDRTVSNSILWDSGSEISYSSGSFSIEYSNVYGGWSGTGNINANPAFADSNGADNVAGNEDDNYRLASSSPCIDNGTNVAVPSDLLVDISGYYRIANTIVDMGAYEHNSMLYLGLCGDSLHPVPSGDITGDCMVDIDDVAVLAENWLLSSTDELAVCGSDGYPSPEGDVTADCTVDICDLAVLASDWLISTRP